jgi:small GTP-binding protein
MKGPQELKTVIKEDDVEERLFKVLVVGDAGCGKTAIIKRYVHGTFGNNYKATIGVDFALKVIQKSSDLVIRIQLWDIAGQERFGNMTRVYYREAVAGVVVYDLAREVTLEGALKWRQDISSKLGDIPVVLFANKSDAAPMPDKTQMDALCKQHGFIGWVATSAKNNSGIIDGVNLFLDKLVPTPKPATTDTIKLGDQQVDPVPPRSCCD